MNLYHLLSRQRPRAAILVIFILGLLILIIIAATSYALSPKLPKGLTIDGLPAGGITIAEVKQKWTNAIEAMEQSTITLQGKPDLPHAESRTLTFKQLGWGLDDAAMFDQLQRIQRNSPWQRLLAKWQLRNEHLQSTATIDEHRFAKTIHEQWSKLQQQQPINASRSITADDRIVYNEGVAVQRIHLAQLRIDILELTQKIWPDQINQGRNRANADKYALDLPLATHRPELTVAHLKSQGVTRKIMQFATSFTASNIGRNHNIRITANTMDGWILKPGDIFDYEQIIAKTRAEATYREAPIILNGKIVPGIGGGICQVSTTLYNAILRAGLEVVERRNHSLPIGYAPLGQDATFSTGYINFRFRNNTDTYLIIKTNVTQTGLTVKLFGSLPANVKYQVKSTIVKKMEPPTKYVHNPNLAPGTMRTIQQGKVGYVVDTERVKIVDGQQVSTEKISRDTYQPKPRIVAKNIAKQERVSPHKQPKRQIIEDGLSSTTFAPL